MERGVGFGIWHFCGYEKRLKLKGEIKMNHPDDGIYFTAKMTQGSMNLKMTIIQEGKKQAPSIELNPSKEEIRKFLNLFYDILDKATLEGVNKNRIIKFLDDGINGFLSGE